ncbi:TonB-dependent receptor [Methylobacillus gramineus]|uniref:TonB-dependent receptor n=1 Tax=Methylobacillus gramineus TaxID=755169 RepID=UPI001CFFBF60|nr:TonB-dependent receptor [Methylobacillus gramineus]MCB5184093.1 TonB-dependent receptor [Methylobacillus gramineus]
MLTRDQFRLSTIAILVAHVCGGSFSAQAADETITTDKVNVVSTTPLPSLGLPLEYVPASIQLVTGPQLQKQRSVTIADYMNQNLQGVSVNETQNNPFQPDILFRGYTASPLLGTPQGLSVFVDGVRVNEPFGDAVNWDLIPVNAIQGMSLIPGSNPVFGLNTLGGAISVQTKSGRTNQGGALEAYTGSWGRKVGSAEYGGVSQDGSVDYFVSATSFREDGWRDHSPTDVRQIFGKVGWQNETSKLDLSYTGADNDMIGNGLIQRELMRSLGRDAIHTRPDQTRNTMNFLNLSGSHWFNDDVLLTANTYYRQSNRKTLNGDINDDFEADDADNNGIIDSAELDAAIADCQANNDADEFCTGAINRSNTRQKGYGFNAQLAFNQPFLEKKNQLIVGAGYDHSKIKFTQSSEYGLLNASRGINGLGFMGDENVVNLHGKTDTWSLFATDTLSLNEFWHLTLSGRYNRTTVDNTDKINAPGSLLDPLDPNSDQTLTGKHHFNRFNPAIGLTFTPSKDLTVYGSYNEGTRAPTSMELGCANPLVPCKLPNAMAGDPPLKQVVAKTFEAGVRGNLTQAIKWSAAVYRAENHDDIQFISNNVAGLGYFDNVGKTRRVGIDTSLIGTQGDFSWSAGYSYVRATYESDLNLLNEVNSTASNDQIQVRKGDRLANIPEHQFKLRVQYEVTPHWSIGTNLTMFSDVYVRGNENNRHRANDGDDDHYQGSGKLGGYTVVNVDTSYRFSHGWSVFAKAINIFDKEYATGGMLGETFLNDGGQFTGNERTSAYAMPGAPRAGWIGVRWEFGGPKNVAAN